MSVQRFESSAVLVNGASRPLVPGTRVVVTVRDGAVSATAGCNTMSVQAGVVDGRLHGRVVMTLKSCGAERDEQDRWLGAFLGSGPTWEEGDGLLRLTAGDTTIVLAAVADG
ncbi:MAG: META domain-containing protein [Actinomycetota bacterium]|nr:META domain-containing protein [Actinomycetota bacterium]